MFLSALLIAGVPMAAFVGAVFFPHFGFVAAGVLGPIVELMRRQTAMGSVAIATQRLAAGDLGHEIDRAASTAEIEVNLERIRKALADGSGAGAQLSKSHSDELRTTLHATRELLDVVSGQTAAVEAAASQLGDLAKTLEDSSAALEAIEVDSTEWRESASSFAQSGQQVDADAGALASAVSESSASITVMTRSITSVAERVSELSRMAEDTTATMGLMDTAIDQVRRNANDTVRLSEQVAEVANHGFDVLEQTIVGIHKIKDSSLEATQVMDALGAKIGEIDKILQVIDDVAEQTNLLALNAAIIAAQAGEHGKGFAVVADEIKDLAERAGISTKEIAELIVAVQQETSNAITAVEAGSVLVDKGVRLSTDAEDALRKIVETAEQSRAMVDNIAQATVEQAASSKHAMDSINRITDTVHVIAGTTSEQCQGFAAVMLSAESMRELSIRVATTTAARSQTSKQVSQSVAQLATHIAELGDVGRRQTSAAKRAAEAVERIRRALDARGAGIESLRGSLSRLDAPTSRLRNRDKRAEQP